LITCDAADQPAFAAELGEGGRSQFGDNIIRHT
jgi:hypothetical protein